MKTPKAYQKMLACDQLTDELIGQVIYSINKRAKNYRDKAADYRHDRFDRYNNFQQYQDKKVDCYQMKDDLLDLYLPLAIHTSQYDKRRRIYDYESDYQSQRKNSIYENRYWDHDELREVKFIDVLVSETVYYLYYEIGSYSFHRPLKKQELATYSRLPLKLLEDNFKVHGEKIDKLLSLQFCKKVHDYLMK